MCSPLLRTTGKGRPKRRRRRRGLNALRYAVALMAGWHWCHDHERPRWDGYDSCYRAHPPIRRDRLAVCRICACRHGPMEWGSDCEPLDLVYTDGPDLSPWPRSAPRRARRDDV